MLDIKTYTVGERTIAQQESMARKKAGDFVTLIYDGDNLVAIGYRKSETSSIKVPDKKSFRAVNESDFDFIYWN